jgi:streptomycin 6-kinase
MITVPQKLIIETTSREGAAARQWIERLPQLAQDQLQRWNCRPDGPVTHGGVALIMPVSSPRGPAVIKISFPHQGNVGEPQALQVWAGAGAVELYEQDPDNFAMLLERVGPDTLNAVPTADEALVIAGQLAARLAVPADCGVSSVAAGCDHWEQQLQDQRGRADSPLDDRVVAAAIETIRDLAQDTTPTMIHGDLHAANILASERDGWVVIDPKGWTGPLAFDTTTIIRDRAEEILQSGDLRGGVLHRIAVYCEASGGDPDLARRCTQAAMVSSALWERIYGLTRIGAEVAEEIAELLTPVRNR